MEFLGCLSDWYSHGRRDLSCAAPAHISCDPWDFTADLRCERLSLYVWPPHYCWGADFA